jgi:hypothetical protein
VKAKISIVLIVSFLPFHVLSVQGAEVLHAPQELAQQQIPLEKKTPWLDDICGQFHCVLQTQEEPKPPALEPPSPQETKKGEPIIQAPLEPRPPTIKPNS